MSRSNVAVIRTQEDWKSHTETTRNAHPQRVDAFPKRRVGWQK